MTFAKIIKPLALAVLLGWTQQALAAPIFYDSYSVLNNQTVRVVDTALGFDETGGSGQITLYGGNIPGGALETWCVDIKDWLQNAGSFASVGKLTGDFGSKVNALLSNASQYLSTNYNASAALQIAIWKVEYGSDLTVTMPNSATALSLADTWVADVSGLNPVWKPNASMEVSVLRANGTNQEQAFLTAVAQVAVPEPASAAMLLGALSGFVVLRHRKKPLPKTCRKKV